MSDENFIPWSMIEPLVRDGMSADELKAALCRVTGLDPARHVFVTKVYSGVVLPGTFWQCLRDGLYVEPRAVVGTGDHRWFGCSDIESASPTVGRASSAAAERSPQDASGPA